MCSMIILMVMILVLNLMVILVKAHKGGIANAGVANLRGSCNSKQLFVFTNGLENLRFTIPP